MDAEWAAVALVLVGFLGSLVNALWARRERIYAGRSADLALEVQESMAASQAAIAAALSRPAVAFDIVEHGKRWMLRNKGQETATDVWVDWPDWIRIINDTEDLTRLEPGSGIVFGGAPRRFGESRETATRVTCAQLPEGANVTLPGF